MGITDRISVLLLVLYSIPESFILISLSSALYGYEVKSNYKRILVLSVCLASTTFIVRYMPIKFGLNVILEIPIFILLTKRFLQVSFKKALVIIITGFVIIALTEATLYSIISALIGQKLNLLFDNKLSRLMMAWIELIVLSIPAVIVIKKEWTFISAVQFVKTVNLNTKVTVLIILVLLQALLAGGLQLLMVFDHNLVFPIAINSTTLQEMIGISLIGIPIVSVVILKRLFAAAEKEAVLATQDAYIASINNLFLAIRGQRHDFINQVQVLYSMISRRETENALTYMEGILKDIEKVNEVIKVKNLALSSLLNSFLAMAERKGIVFETVIEANLEEIRIRSVDLVRILGNLINNAYEAVLDQTEEFRKIRIEIKRLSNLIVVEIINPRPVIPKEQLSDIFTVGFSTKQGHTGLGLAITKELVDKYNGDIGLKSEEEEGTVFTVVLPLLTGG